MTLRLSALLLAITLSSRPAMAQTADSAHVVATVEAFHAALAGGDSAAALTLLAPDAIVLESGARETRDEYRAHHLPADIEFARTVESIAANMNVTIIGDVAWVSSSSTTRGTFRGRAVDATGAELMVLARSDSVWVIRAIHWSSRARRTGS